MGFTKSDTVKVMCEVCYEIRYFLPNEKYKFYSEHYYKHELDDMGNLKRSQEEYDSAKSNEIKE